MLLMASGDPKGFTIWKDSDLKARVSQLAQKMNAQKMASETLADYGHYQTMLAHREASGGAELHEKMADIFVVQSGEGTLVVGGEIPNAKTTAPNEVRGDAVKGGERHRVSAGDVVNIPAGVPHQLLLDPGHQITYFVVKVEKR
jgi:mannose-6-phosphate isomerase-like protein (cupin superfamily)